MINTKVKEKEPLIKAQDEPQAKGTAETNGWDLVTAIRFPDVNKAIVAQKSSPPSFDFSQTDDLFGKVAYKGDFGDWQLTGGDGKFVIFSMPITNGVFTIAGSDRSYPLKMVATVEVNMLWVSEKVSDSNFDLKIDNSVKAVVEDIDIGENMDPNNKPISETEIGLLKQYLGLWLIDHVKAFDHVFASVDIAEEADTGEGLAWLKPTDKLYGVTSSDNDPTNLNAMIFAVLCMTEGRPAPGDHNVSPFAIPDGCRAGFLISPERMLSKMFLHGMPYLFTEKYDGSHWVKGITSDDFTVENLSITNKYPMRFIQQTLDNGKVVQPRIDAKKFNLRYHTNGIEMDMADLNFEYSPGIRVHVNHVAPATLSINSERKFVLNTGTTSTATSVTTSTGVLVAEIVGGIAAAILGAAVGGMLGAAAEGGEVVAVEATEATIDTITTTAAEAGEDAVTNVSEETIEEATAEVASEESGELSKFGKFKLFLAKNWPKLLGMAIGSAIAATVPNVIKLMANESTMPTIDKLGTESLAPVTWPNLEQDSFYIKSGGVNGSLQIGFDVK